MSFFGEFKAFAMRGNVVDMATGIVIGAAFGKIVTSLVSGVIMPPIGWLIGGIDFSKLKWIIQAAGADGKGEVAIQWGAFVNTIITFIIIALAIFCVIKLMNRAMAKPDPEPAATPADVALLTEIRDLLKNK
ncbi:MAG: large-conductance mechanosensitive channel protein MscL [Xanthomonadales bacterium]|nr:large-conductance mechanosensitive channel protein MscL [Xanthomonadales bacterium]